jgi:hypothetical protein
MARGADMLLGMGGFAATGASPNGQPFMVRPRWMAPITSSSARLDGGDLGSMEAAVRPSSLGDFVIPRRPLFAAGLAFFDNAMLIESLNGAAPEDEQGELLSKYVCQRLVSRVIEASHAGTFGDERAFATVLFIDISGFTGLAERCEPVTTCAARSLLSSRTTTTTATTRASATSRPPTSTGAGATPSPPVERRCSRGRSPDAGSTIGPSRSEAQLSPICP